MGPKVSAEERAARQRRLAIIVVVALVLALAAGAFRYYVERRADDAQADLRRRLTSAAPTLDHEEVLAGWYEFLATPDDPGNIANLPEEDRIAIRAEGDTVIAVYKAGFAGQDRCFDLKVESDGTNLDERSC